MSISKPRFYMGLLFWTVATVLIFISLSKPTQAQNDTIMQVLRDIQKQQFADAEMWVYLYTRPVMENNPSTPSGRITRLSDSVICLASAYEYCLAPGEIVYLRTNKPINSNR